MKNPIIDIQHLKYHYPDAHKLVVNNVNLRLFKGEWLALIGLNGSGKSTLVKLIDGLLPRISGNIYVNGVPVVNKNLFQIRSNIGIVFQNPKDQFVGVTVKDEVAFGLENRQVPPQKIKKIVKQSLNLVGMQGYYNTLVDNLSGGQQQRIAIADVIAVKPQIMILDECTSMLDPQGRKKILRLVNTLKRRFKLTVIDITHDVSETRYAQKIAIMSNGRLIMNDTPSKVFQDGKLLKSLHLSLPQSDVLRDLLRKQGVKVPKQHFSEMGMLTWLHQLYLRM